MSRSREEFLGQPHAVGRGRAAESAAVAWLVRCGYRVVERNVETAAGEIDLVAEEDGVLCFVEIKALEDTRYGGAVARVDAGKQGRIARAAALYLAASGWPGPCRFDVLGLEPGDDDWRYELVRDAFETENGW